MEPRVDTSTIGPNGPAGDEWAGDRHPHEDGKHVGGEVAGVDACEHGERHLEVGDEFHDEWNERLEHECGAQLAIQFAQSPLSHVRIGGHSIQAAVDAPAAEEDQRVA